MMAAMTTTRQIGIGLAGLGTVGAGVAKHLARNRALLLERLGLELVVRRAVARDLTKARPGVELPAGKLTGRWEDLIEDPAVEIIVELLGGIDTPLALIRAAIAAGKTVVTGNKALLAEHGQEIFALAAERRVPVFFEASTAGGIPIIKSIREAFIANHFRSIHGIINGTSNYILTRMTEQPGLDFAEALAEAQAAGYAEADVRRVARLIKLSEYKRRQSPVGIRITHRAFGRDWRYPITNRFES